VIFVFFVVKQHIIELNRNYSDNRTH